jgi:hypothetical protein
VIDVQEHMAIHKPKWMHNPDRNCRTVNTQAFFDGTAKAVAVCVGCPVQEPCLEHAITHSERGVWGGMSERARDRYRRNRDKNNKKDKAS